MINKTNSELRELFGLSRDDIRRLEDDGVLNPKKEGQGKAALYGLVDVNILLDVKLLLLSGYRVADMKNIINDSYNSDAELKEQIHTYKKRIQMLEFIRRIRADLRKLDQFSKEQLFEAGKIPQKSYNIPNFQKYYDMYLDIIKLILLLETLSKKNSFIDHQQSIVIKRFYDAYRIVEKLIQLSGRKIPKEELIDFFTELTEFTTDDEYEIRSLINEIINEKKSMIDEIKNESTPSYFDELEDEIAVYYKDVYMDIVTFFIDYFIDEDELYYLFYNFILFANNLDKDSLNKYGIITIKGGKYNE